MPKDRSLSMSPKRPVTSASPETSLPADTYARGCAIEGRLTDLIIGILEQ
jgi:hypothetical protein